MFRPPTRRPGRSDMDVPVLGLLVILLLLLMAGGGGVVLWQWKRAEMMRREAMQMELVVRDEAERARAEAEMAQVAAEEARRNRERPVEDILREGRRRAAAPVLERGLTLCTQGQINAGLLWFVRGLEDAGDDADTGRAFRANLAAWGLPQPDAREVLRQKGAVTALAVSPDGLTVLTGAEDGAARAWPVGGGQVAGEARGEGKVSAVAFGAGAKEWLVAAGDELRRLDAATRQAIGEPEEAPGTVLAVTATADGHVKTCGTCEQGVWLSEDAARPKSKQFTPDSRVLSVALAADGRLILTGHEDHTARLWGADGKAVGEALRPGAPVRAVAVSSDGRLLATGAGTAARLWDATARQPIGRPLPHGADVGSLAFSADGKRLFAGDQAGTVREWAVPAPLEGDVARLKLWAEVTASAELDAAGAVRPLDAASRADRRRKLEALGGPPRP